MIDLSQAQLVRTNQGWAAILEDPPLMATGGSKRDARENLRLRAEGKTPKNERPHLKLCMPCNRAAAEAGDAAHTVGVEVCATCARAIDQWKKDMNRWRNRRKKNRRRPR